MLTDGRAHATIRGMTTRTEATATVITNPRLTVAPDGRVVFLPDPTCESCGAAAGYDCC
jgi:hypothetical protein